jgi:hypothetical protein
MLHLTIELWALHIYYQKTTGTAYLLPKSYEKYRVYMHLAGKVQNVTLATGPKHVAVLINGSRGGITTKGKVIQVSHSISLSLAFMVALRQRRNVNDIGRITGKSSSRHTQSSHSPVHTTWSSCVARYRNSMWCIVLNSVKQVRKRIRYIFVNYQLE